MEEIMGEPETVEVTGVVATLDRVDGVRRFVVQNLGESSAFDVRFDVAAEREKNDPVSAADLRRAFPVKELRSGESVSVAAIITPGTGLHFRGVVTWKSPEGADEERVFYMSA